MPLDQGWGGGGGWGGLWRTGERGIILKEYILQSD